MRKTNKAGLDLIKRYEGLRLTSYLDTGGVWTIGYGHTSDVHMKVHKGQRISQTRADQLLVLDLAEAEQAVEQLVKVELNDNQFATLVSFVYNLGVGAFKKSTLLRKLNAGQYGSVPTELMRFVYDNGKRIEGLANRRAAEVGLWVKANPKSPVVDVVPSTTQPDTPTGTPMIEAMKSPEIIVGAGVPAAGAIFSAATGSTILAWAVAAVMVIAALGFAYWFFMKKKGQNAV